LKSPPGASERARVAKKQRTNRVVVVHKPRLGDLHQLGEHGECVVLEISFVVENRRDIGLVAVGPNPSFNIIHSSDRMH